jgi:hypothetical protein
MRVFFSSHVPLSWLGVKKSQLIHFVPREELFFSNLIGSTDLLLALTLCDACRASPSCHGLNLSRHFLFPMELELLLLVIYESRSSNASMSFCSS